MTDHIDDLRMAFRMTKERHPFTLDAIVVLPDHLHAMFTLPIGDADFALRWRLIKTHFSHRLPSGERLSQSRIAHGERGIWQRRYWEHSLRDETDYAHHADYLHYNPVKHGHVQRAKDWPYSSFHQWVRRGYYPADWANEAQDELGGFGEL